MKYKEDLATQLLATTNAEPNKDNVIICDFCRVTVLENRLFRIEFGEVTDEATQVVWFRNFPKVDFRCEKNENEILMQTDSVKLCVNKHGIEYSSVTFPDGRNEPLNNEKNLYGTCRTLDADGEKLVAFEDVRQVGIGKIPLDFGVCASNGVAVYDDSTSLLLMQDGKLRQRNGGNDIYVFAYGHDYKAAVKALYRICGQTPALPRWAFGNWWSRYWPYTQREYVNLMDSFEEEEIPISVAVLDMDWHYVQIDREFSICEQGLDGTMYGGINGWTGYTWNKKLFPNHRKLLDNLHARGMHITLNLHPADGVRWFEEAYPNMASHMGMKPSDKKVVPFQIDNPRFVNAYFQELHHPLEREGVDFWWIDWQQGKNSGMKGLDPLWALNHYHYLDIAHRRKDALILSRYSGVGSHRYPVGFSGDTYMDWQFLDYMPYFTATAANAGYGWWSHDIGGHHRGIRDEELYLRWLQFGVFSPINRIHSCPDEVVSKEPWTLTVPMRETARKWFRFRHKLIPYLQSASIRNSQGGMPLIVPMYYDWPEECEAYKATHQYMFGNLLVAPITEKAKELGIARKWVWLPEGSWTDVFNNFTYEGGKWVCVCRDVGEIPVFARAGTILPLDSKVQNNCEKPSKLDLIVYSGNGSYTLFEENDSFCFESVMPMYGKQVLSIVENPRDMNYHVCFPNIKSGICELMVNGKRTSVKTRENHCLQVDFTLFAEDRAELSIIHEPSKRMDRIRKGILQRLIQLQLSLVSATSAASTLQIC